MRSPLTATIQRVQGMIDYVRENLDEGEYDLFLDLIVPEPEPPTPKKRGRKKKSARAQSLSNTIKVNTATRTVVGPACGTCGNVEDHPDHDVDHYLSAHEFESGKSSAKPARKRSLTNGAGTPSIVNSEAAKVNVATAIGGSSE